MRFRSFVRFILVGLIVPVAISGLDAGRLQAQAGELVLDSPTVSIPQAISGPPVTCDSAPFSLRLPWRFNVHLALRHHIETFGETTASHPECVSIAYLFHNTPVPSMEDLASSPPSQQTLRASGVPEARPEGPRTRAFEYYYVFGPGCGMCGGLNQAPFYSLELGGDEWVARYWEVRGTYVDHQPGIILYQYSSAWSLDVGKKMGEVTVYAGWASLRHYWSSSSWTDLAGPTVGARWTAGSLSFDLALRQASPGILGNSAKVTLSIPLSENLSTTIGLDQWVYFLSRTGFYQWTNPYIGLKTEW